MSVNVRCASSLHQAVGDGYIEHVRHRISIFAQYIYKDISI